MDPSTSERSYGPLTRALDASGKEAISICPATASSSSSQSSRLNWQPSQEANFQTASFGLCCTAISYLSLSKPPLERIIAEHRTILALKERPKLAMSTQTQRALHIAFQGKKDMLPCQPALLEFQQREVHHDLRPAEQRDGIKRIKLRGRDESRNHAHVAVPGIVTTINSHLYIKVSTRAPAFQFAPIEQIGRSPRAIEQHHPAIVLALRQDLIDGRAERRQPKPSGHNDYIASSSLLNGPVAAKRPPHPKDIVAFQRAHHPGHGPNGPDGMHQ